MQELTALKGQARDWENLLRTQQDLCAHLELAEEAADEKEAAEVSHGIENLKKELEERSFRLKLSGKHDEASAILSLHAGAGGTEACDWAQMLLRMYQRWAEQKGYRFVLTDILPGEEAGVKSAAALVEGPYAYGYLKAEIGVHRLVRISPFDSNKRRHTSFASCDVLPDVENEIEIQVEDKDLRIDTFRAGGHGGQKVNKTESAVRITHLPTATVVQCQNERSQHQNKATCLKMLKAKLYELEQEKLRTQMEKHYDEKGDIAWGHQIRSYVFMPYQMVKDLRTGLETPDVHGVLGGALDPLLHSYLAWQAQRTGSS